MSEMIGCGPPWAVEGPPPVRPLYGLLQAADASTSAAGVVRIVTDTDEGGRERWLNGIEVRPYPADTGAAHNPYKPGTSPNEKGSGVPKQNPQFGAFTAYAADGCSTLREGREEQFRQRLLAKLSAVEGAIAAEQFLSGSEYADTVPYLADGNGTFPVGSTAVSPLNGVALLVREIAKSRVQGLIHMSPYLAERLAASGYVIFDEKAGIVRTVTGRLVIVDDGYTDGASPVGKTAATGNQEWIYASGPVDVRRSAPFIIPEEMAQAMDRGLGGGGDNDFTFRAERHYLVSWDTVVQAAVRVDPCVADCP